MSGLACRSQRHVAEDAAEGREQVAAAVGARRLGSGVGPAIGPSWRRHGCHGRCGQLFALKNLKFTKIGSLVLNLSRLAVDLLEIGRYRRPRSHPSQHLVSFLFPVFVGLL